MPALDQDQLAQVIAELQRLNLVSATRRGGGGGVFTGVRSGCYSFPSEICVDAKGRVTRVVSGGPSAGWFQEAIWVDGANTDPSADGSMLNPLPTITAAVALATSLMDALPPMTDVNQPVGTRNRQRQVIVVAGGIYDEDITITRANLFLEFLALGPVVLGDANFGTPNAGLFFSTIPRNIEYHSSLAQEAVDFPAAVTSDDSRRPQLVFGVFPQMGTATSTIASSWMISGHLSMITDGGAPNASAKELHLQNVLIQGDVDGSANQGIVNCYFYRSKFDAAFSIPAQGGGGARLNEVEDSEFDGPTDVEAYGKVVGCEFDGTVDIDGFFNANPPGGFVNCDFSGGPITGSGVGVLPLRIDGITNYFIKTNGVGLVNAAKTIQDDIVP